MSRDKIYAIHIIDNWDGEGDRYWALARKHEDGYFVSEETGNPLIQYEGDQILRIVPLSAPQEPVAWLYEDELPDSYPYETMFPYSKVDGVRMFPVYAPQPAEQQPSVDDSPTPVPDELFAAEFNAWWEQHGQFCRAGGGDYERTFAFEAWRHLYPQLMNLQMAAAEQQPISHDWDDQDKCRRCGDRDWYAGPICTPKQPIEQQPAPDMPGLTEALRQYQHNDGSGLVFGYDRLLVDQYVTQLMEALEDIAGTHHHSASAGEYFAKAARSSLAAHRKGGEA